MTITFETDWLAEPAAPLTYALNRLPGVTCIAHESVALGSSLPESYSVTFEVEHTEVGWHSLAFLAWLINGWLHDESVQLLLTAPPPCSDGARGDVAFVLQGNNGHDPLVMTSLLNRAMLECFELLKEQQPLSDKTVGQCSP